MDSCLLRSSIFDLENAYQKHDKEQKGLPKFKSKTRSRNRKIKDLSIREWKCENCKNINDRDLSVSINIMYEGVKKYMDELQVS